MVQKMFLRLLWLFLLLIAAAANLEAQDKTINTDALWHDSRDDRYRAPGGAAPLGTTVRLRLRAAAGDLDTATVRVWNTRAEAQTLLPMQVIAATPEGYDLWEAAVEVGDQSTVLWYRFIVTQGNQTLYYEDDTRPENGAYQAHREGGPGAVYEQSPDLSYQITIYDPEFYTPEWMRNATIYQIFPDRFRDGDPANNPSDDSDTFYGTLPLIFHETWNEPPVNGREVQAPDGQGYYNSDFFGGDLAGITEKLDYIQSLGVTAIYLNPIFEARSNHRYDTADYLKIDPTLGDMTAFRTLVEAADQRGIKLILDGVFNHMSSDSAIFDRYHRFEGDEGACESVDSEYRDWFFFVPPRTNQPAPCAGDPDPLYYLSWASFDSIPKLNSENQDVIRYIFFGKDSVTRFWGLEGIGGWRLDVAPEIDNGRDPGNVYWEFFRRAVRGVNPETVIIGEEWGDASEFFGGDEWDSTMNYRLRSGILGFVRDDSFSDNDANGDRIIYPLTPSELDSTIRSIEEDYPAAAYHALMNVLDSHDVSRVGFVLDNDSQSQKLAALTQFTLPGAPTVYYGDEITLNAPSEPDSGGVLQDDPFNRAPYPWPDTEGDHYPTPDDDMLAFYQQLGALRRDNPALREGEMVTLLTDDTTGLYAFLRIDRQAGNAALVALNNSDQEQTAEVRIFGLLPLGVTLEPNFGGEPLSTNESEIMLTVPANSGEVWTISGAAALLARLPAPTNVRTSSYDGQVLVTWDRVDDAIGYLIYRSPVASGGFELAHGIPISDQAYPDNDVTNGYLYYYAIVPINEKGVMGEMSVSALGVPSNPISAAYYVGEYDQPVTVERLFGTTVDLQAAVAVEGATGGDQAAKGIRAEAALIPAGGDSASADWQPMTYTGARDGADVYGFTFSPQAIGSYAMAARFSIDAGQTWTEVKLENGQFPQLEVTTPSDTTAPPAPADVRITAASLSGVTLEWDAVADNDLIAYRVYRLDEPNTVMVAEIPVDTTTYTDTTVQENATYIYGVAAVDRALNESEQTLADAVTVERLKVQVTLTVEVPAATNSPVYLAGSFGKEFPSWDPGGMPMTQVDDTHWTITLELIEGTAAEYKYVRGDWSAVEKGANCEEIANRRLTATPGEDNTQQVQDTVIKWRDLDNCG